MPTDKVDVLSLMNLIPQPHSTVPLSKEIPKLYRKMSKKQARINDIHEEIGAVRDSEKGKLKVPMEYAEKFLGSKNLNIQDLMVNVLNPGSGEHSFISAEDTLTRNNLNNEIRVSYLATRLKTVQEFYEREIKEIHIRNQAKMRTYAKSCFDEIKDKLKH